MLVDLVELQDAINLDCVVPSRNIRKFGEVCLRDRTPGDLTDLLLVAANFGVMAEALALESGGTRVLQGQRLPVRPERAGLHQGDTVGAVDLAVASPNLSSSLVPLLALPALDHSGLPFSLSRSPYETNSTLWTPSWLQLCTSFLQKVRELAS